MNYCVTYISAWLLMGKKCTAWRLTCGSMLIAWKDMITHFANLSNDISTQRKKRSTENWIKVTRTLRTPVLLNTTPVIHQKKNKKRKNPFDKKKNFAEWNEMKYCSLWVSRRGVPGGRWRFASWQLWERIQAGAQWLNQVSHMNQNWPSEALSPASFGPIPSLKWWPGTVNASYKNPLFKIFFLVLITGSLIR